MNSKKVYLTLTIATGSLYGATLVAIIVLTALGIMDNNHVALILSILFLAFFAGAFMHCLSQFYNRRTIESSLKLENLYSLGQRSTFYNLYAFTQRANVLRRSFRYAKKEQYLIVFTASSVGASRSRKGGDEIADLNSRIANYLGDLFKTRGGQFDKRKHLFCFDRGAFVLYCFDRSRKQIDELVITLRDKVYGILQDKRYHIYVQPFFGVAKTDPFEPMMSQLDNANLARDNAERNFESFSYYDPSMRKDYSESQIAEIVSAFENHEFVVYYQPKFSLTKKQFVSSEALIRWNSPKYGLVPPSKFLEPLEAAGLLHELDVYVFKTVCQDLAETKRRGRRLLPVSVNFSLYEFYSLDFLSSVLNTIREAGIDPSLIEVEITETTSQANTFLSVSIIKKLKEAGLRILMDDFGIGYSNIANLRKIPFDAVKIDKSFIDALRDDPVTGGEVVKMIIGLCKAAGYETIAEGVDGKDEVDFLRRARCDTIQGFYYSEAISKDRYDRFLLDNPFEGGKK